MVFNIIFSATCIMLLFLLFFCCFFLFTSGPTNSTNSTVTAGTNIVYSIGVVGFSLILLLLLVVLVLLVVPTCFPCCGTLIHYETLKERISEALEGQWMYLNASTKIIAHTESLTCITTLI